MGCHVDDVTVKVKKKEEKKNTRSQLRVSVAVSGSQLERYDIHTFITLFPFYAAASMSAPILRIFLPQGYKFPYVQLSRSVRPPRISYRTPPICQNASTRASKPRVLEKPTRFNPPSHGKRLKERTPRQYGPQLTEEQKVEQQTKKYPHMMPAEGTFMYWFLTSRGIHTFISMVRGQLDFCIHCQNVQFSSRYTTLNSTSGHSCPPRQHHGL